MDNLHYREYFDAMPCYLSVQDRSLRVLTANRKFREDFGDWEGRYCYQVYKNRPEKCDICPVERTFHDAQKHSSEEQVTCLKGRQVSVIVNTTPICDSAGQISAVMEMSTDITDIKSLQQQLKESRTRYRMLLEEVPCFLSIQDNQLNIVEANRLHREAFGSYYECKCFQVYKHREEECYPCTVRQTFGDARVHVHEEVVESRNGLMNVLVHTAPIRNTEGRISHVIEMTTDITQIRELQDQLSSIGMLISSISHGIKGMLNGMDGGVYLVNSGLKNNDSARLSKGWEIVTRNIGRIKSMVLDILYYAKDRELNYEQIDPTEIIEEVFDLLVTKARDLGIELVKDIPKPSGDFEGDRNALRAALMNLVENSLDACRIDSKKVSHSVKIGLWEDNSSLKFEVEDNGIGMDQETREKAFSLFFSSKGAEGTGLGLFIANKIVRAHGGTLQLESRLDIGTKFTLNLQRTRPTPHVAGTISE